MDKTGAAIPPIIFLQVLHMAYPQFAEKSEHGGFAQQVKFFIFLLIHSTHVLRKIHTLDVFLLIYGKRISSPRLKLF